MAVERIQYGINGPEPPLFSRLTDPQTTPFKYMRDFSISHNKTSILEETGPYIAEVIRVFEPYLMPVDDKTIPLGYWDQFEDGAEGELIVLRVRIPEIDTFGVPQDLPENDAAFRDLTDRDRHLVERYPKCIGKWLNMKRPVVGQAVWVEFRDPKNRAERIYLGTVNETQMAGVGESTDTPGEGESTKDLFNNGTPPGVVPKTLYAAATLDAGVEAGDIFKRRNKDKGRIGEQSGFRRRKPPTVIFIHESAAGFEAYDKGKIPDGGRKLTHAALEKQNFGVHFTVDRQGGVQQHGDPVGWRYDHAGSWSDVSIAIEVLNPARTKLEINEVDGGVFPVFGMGKWYHGYNQILPTSKQMEATWKLVNQLASAHKIKIGFIALKGNTFNYSKIPANPSTAFGIIAHRHISSHSDGSHVELYCVLRAKGWKPAESYSFVMNAIIKAGKAKKSLNKIEITKASV